MPPRWLSATSMKLPFLKVRTLSLGLQARQEGHDQLGRQVLVGEQHLVVEDLASACQVVADDAAMLVRHPCGVI